MRRPFQMSWSSWRRSIAYDELATVHAVIDTASDPFTPEACELVVPEACGLEVAA